MNRNSQRGVALVITLIMLSIVLIMAVLFLGISRRERASVSGNIEFSNAKNAAEHGQTRAVAEIIARMTAQSNDLAYGMMVSTNRINPNGFQPGLSSFENVSYTYANGQPLNGNDIRINLTNLFYDPRPPVFVVNNRGTTEFRYYLDLNRNGRFDTNGYQVVLVPDSQSRQTNFYFGDPEWIGVLEHPDQPHSGTNRFMARYAFLVVPAGRTLDINYIHNNARAVAARQFLSKGFLGFSRNQGVGSWEINLAAFFRDLNTNYWPPGPLGYHYNPLPGGPTTGGGSAFSNALEILSYRCGSDFRMLNSVQGLANFGSKGTNFQYDRIDEYGDDLPLTGLSLSAEGPASVVKDATTEPWFGSENTNGYTRIDELFDPTKTSADFANNRLRLAQSSPGIYNQNTFYRLMAQLGTDSLPANRGKLHLNYDNVNLATGQIDPSVVAGLTNWTPIRFFTNAADLMLRSQFGVVATNVGLSVTNIQVYPVNLYVGSVHRLLQLAANIYDASTNRFLLAAGTNSLYAPSVFRPLFSRKGSGTNLSIFVSGYEEVTNVNQVLSTSARWVDLNRPGSGRYTDGIYGRDAISDEPRLNLDISVFGIPYVIGARKGFPNFNELFVQTLVQVTRRLEVEKKSAADKPVFHQSYEIGISNYLAMEAWNSYTQAFPRPLRMIVTNSTWLAFSNATPGKEWATSKAFLTRSDTTNNWKGQEFRVPISNSVVFIPDSEFSFENPRGLRPLQENVSFDHSQGFPVPDWKLTITNRLQFILVDNDSRRIVDFVNLDRVLAGMDIMRELLGRTNAFADTALNSGSFWSTNRVQNISTNMTWGITNQIFVSTNEHLVADDLWASFTDNPISGRDKEDAIDNFRKIMGLRAWFHSDNTNVPYGVVQVPFTPTRKLDQPLSWQVNDPLVHYHIDDLYDPAYASATNVQTLKAPYHPDAGNIGQINRRYRPWGGTVYGTPGDDPSDHDLAIKDPLITRSDDWDFPTNKFPTIGWLGRVHRGSPWQTVYLKSEVEPLLGTGDGKSGWLAWAGRVDTHPTNDWHLLSLFTIAPNDVAARGLLSVNQTNIAAWSAVLSGVPVITNGLTTLFIEPASPQLNLIVSNINATRLLMPNQVFPDLGSVLRSPALTVASPFLNTRVASARISPPLSDEFYERIPQQILSLLKDDEPYVVIYAFGQSLKPAADSIVTAPGAFRGLCTNYQVTAEVATKTAVRIEVTRRPRQPNTYKAVVESYSILPAD